MTQLIHTPGGINVGENGELYSASKYRSIAMVLLSDDGEANARLLAAAYNAFDSAAKKLGWNAVKLAERAQGGAIADVIDALISAEQFIRKQSGGGETEFRATLLTALMKINPGTSYD